MGPLGVAPAPRFHEASSRLPPGATVLLYTDGLIERPGQSIDEGFERLREVASLGAADPGVLAGHVLREMLGDAVRPDDVALLAVHLVPLPPELDIRLPGPRDDLASLREELRLAGPAGRANRARRGDHPRLQRGDRQCDGARLRRPRGARAHPRRA